MKIAFFSAVISLFFAVSVYAEEPQGNGNPMLVTQPWGLNALQTPKLAPGEGDCPIWYTMGCSDISETDWYQMYLEELNEAIRQLKLIVNTL